MGMPIPQAVLHKRSAIEASQAVYVRSWESFLQRQEVQIPDGLETGGCAYLSNT